MYHDRMGCVVIHEMIRCKKCSILIRCEWVKASGGETWEEPSLEEFRFSPAQAGAHCHSWYRGAGILLQRHVPDTVIWEVWEGFGGCGQRGLLKNTEGKLERGQLVPVHPVSSCFFLFFFFLAVLGIEPRASCMVSMCSTTSAMPLVP